MKNRTFYIVIWCSFLFLPTQINAATNPDIELLRKSFISELLDQPVNEEYVRKLMDTIKPDGSWPGIDYVDTARIAFQHTEHLSNLVQMSRAYKKPGSSLRGNKNLKKVIYQALDFWLAHDFICENWWNNEIGTPSDLTAVLLMMDKDLTKEQIEKTSAITFRANINAWGARPSGDRIKIIGIQAKNALYKRDVDLFEMLIKEIEVEIKKTSDKERGMQHDFSFHHREDRVNNTLSYGAGYAEAFAEWAAKVAGTRYQFSPKSIELLTDYYLDGMCKQMAFGKFADPSTANRDISRPKRGLVGSNLLPERLLKASSYRKDELEEIINIRKNDAKPTLSFSKFFWQTEHYVHQRPDYYTSVRMFSTRNRNMEEPYNGEGLTNHHRADGTNYLTLTGKEYFNIAPVNDWQKIPGTTILQKPSMPSEGEIQKDGITDFVGAVTDGMCGAVAFDFISPHDRIKAHKAWFFFDDAYVCLGAGISSRSGLPVVTTVNQCFLEGDVIMGADNKREVISKGERDVSKASWIFHNGVGYIFPDEMKIQLSNREQEGSWYSINRQTNSSKEKIRKDVFKLWIDHGQRVSNGNYQYIVVPATAADKVESFAQKPNVKILLNTPDIQAVQNTSLGILQAIFYRSGEIQSSDFNIKMDSPGVIMLKKGNDGIKVSVADPSRKLSKIHFSINMKTSKQSDQFTSVWDEAKRVSLISIDLPQGQLAGESVTVTL